MPVRLTAMMLLVAFGLSGCTYYFGNSRAKKFNKEPSSLVPEFNQRPVPLSKIQKREVGLFLIEHWANRKLEGNIGKGSEIRSMIAKLFLNREVEEINSYLLKQEPWGIGGTSSFLNRKGDYDFAEILYCSLVFLFEDEPEKLYPGTVKHIVHNLLIENGFKPQTRAPHMLKLMRDTDNHILMKEATRYLKNQWIFEHESRDPQYDNTTNGMEEWWSAHLKELEETGIYEFNADPYMGYTMNALLTFHAFTNSLKLKQQCERVIDVLNWEYALGSIRFNKCSPFRRRLEKADKTVLNEDPHSAMMRTWLFKYHPERISMEDLPCCAHQALMALMLPYQIPDEIEAMIIKRGKYFVKIGHGFRASPEIYSSGHNYLLSAGGVQRGRRSQIIARPTALLLDDHATDLTDVFHATGKGKLKKWNNTGVYHLFSCSNAPIYIPSRFSPVIEENGWIIFKPLKNDPLHVAIYNEKKTGLMIIFPEWDGSSSDLTKKLNGANPNPAMLYHTFKFPQGPTLTYEINARKNRWVIASVNGEDVDRRFDFWPRLSGWMED